MPKLANRRTPVASLPRSVLAPCRRTRPARPVLTALAALATLVLSMGPASAAPVLSLPEVSGQAQAADAEAVRAGLRALEDRAWTAAEASFQEALRLQPRSWRAALGMAELAAQRGEPATVVDRWIAQALSSAPEDPAVLRAAASWDLRQGRRAEAVQALRKALVSAPQHLGMQLELGEALLAQRDAAAAEAAFRAALSIDATHPGALTGLALALAAQGKDKDALQAFEHAARSAPRDPRPLLAMARYQASKRHIDQAIQTLDRLAAAVPGTPEAHLDKGDLLVMKNDTQGAVDAYRRAAALGGAALGIAEFRLAAVYEAQGRADDAEKAYRRVLRAEPDSYAALNNLAMLLAGRKGQGQEAVELARKAVALAPSRPQAHDTLGWALHAQGKHEDALASVQRALAIDAKPASYAYHQGAILAQLGRKAEARASLERALQHNPRARWSEAARALLAQL